MAETNQPLQPPECGGLIEGKMTMTTYSQQHQALHQVLTARGFQLDKKYKDGLDALGFCHYQQWHTKSQRLHDVRVSAKISQEWVWSAAGKDKAGNGPETLDALLADQGYGKYMR